jgi:polysaccharide pyruvyl transferase WcaK-like protein
VSYDVAFALDPTPPAKLEIAGLSLSDQRQSKLVGLNISGLLFNEGAAKHAFGVRSRYAEIIDSLIDYLIEDKNSCVLLVPHVFGMQVDSECDSPVCESVYTRLHSKYKSRIGIVRGSYDQNEIKYIIGQCDFFIGSRMHACIAAASQGVPAVSIAYSDKFLGVMETIGIESAVLDARQLDKKQILAAIEDLFEQQALTRSHLAKRIPQVKESVLQLFDQIDIHSQKVSTTCRSWRSEHEV